MPKMKTKSAAKKRFKKVGSSGCLIKRSQAFMRHHAWAKDKKIKRRLRRGTYVHAADVSRLLTLLPY